MPSPAPTVLALTLHSGSVSQLALLPIARIYLSDTPEVVRFGRSLRLEVLRRQRKIIPFIISPNLSLVEHDLDAGRTKFLSLVHGIFAEQARQRTEWPGSTVLIVGGVALRLLNAWIAAGTRGYDVNEHLFDWPLEVDGLRCELRFGFWTREALQMEGYGGGNEAKDD